MKIYYTGDASGPVSISFNGRDYQNVSLDALKEGYELPQDADYSKIRVQGSNATLKNISILKQIKVDDVNNEFKVAVGILNSNYVPCGGVLNDTDINYWNPPADYNDILDRYVVDQTENIYSNFHIKSGDGDEDSLYVYLRDSDYFTGESVIDQIMYQVCGNALDRVNGRVDYYEAKIDNIDLAFYNKDTKKFSNYVKIENASDWDSLKEKYDVYIVKTHLRKVVKEVPYKDDDDYSEFVDVAAGESYSKLSSYDNPDGDHVTLISVQVFAGNNKYEPIIRPICKVGKLDQSQDYGFYSNPDTRRVIDRFDSSLDAADR